MPILALIVGIIVVIILHQLMKRSGKGSRPARWVLGGGMIVSLLLASRIFGARILYFFLPMVQQWMMGKPSPHTQQAQPPASSSSMSKQEASLILGVEPEASKAQVNQAYKELMLKLHP